MQNRGAYLNDFVLSAEISLRRARFVLLLQGARFVLSREKQRTTQVAAFPARGALRVILVQATEIEFDQVPGLLSLFNGFLESPFVLCSWG